MNINEQGIVPQVSRLRNLISVAVILVLGCFVDAAAQWSTTGNDIYNSNSGNVGIGTNGAPTAPLEVKKSQNAGTAIAIDNPFTTSGNTAYSAFVLKQAGVNRLHVASVNDNHSFLTAGTAQFWNFMNAPMVFGTNNAEQMRISAAGNVGIGTNAPDVKLQLFHFSTNTNLANMQLADLGFALRNTSNTNGNMTMLSFQDAGGYGNAQIGAIQKDQTNHAADLVFLTRTNTTTYGERMRITSLGNVGIGTTSTPTRKLEVLGGNVFHQWSTTAGTEFGFYTAMANNHFSSNLYYDGLWKMVGAGKGAVIAVSPSIGNAFAVYADNTSRSANASATLTQLLTVTLTGEVGIATTSTPTEKLEVNGNLKVTGTGNITATGTIEGANVKAKYQDVAEWVDSSEELTAATVVVLDPNKSNQVVASSQAYDSSVAGVISLQPGIALGEDGEGRVLVATTGRVKVRVDASNGPIKIGDLLVTSNKPGVAMKSVPVKIGSVRMHRPGTLIGKALEPLAQGSGEILVLLSLQ